VPYGEGLCTNRFPPSHEDENPDISKAIILVSFFARSLWQTQLNFLAYLPRLASAKRRPLSTGKRAFQQKNPSIKSKHFETIPGSEQRMLAKLMTAFPRRLQAGPSLIDRFNFTIKFKQTTHQKIHQQFTVWPRRSVRSN